MVEHNATFNNNNNNNDLIELNTNSNDHDLNFIENTNPNILITTEPGAVLDNGSTVELDGNTNTYNLELIENINPGPPPEGRNYESLRNKPQINSVTLQGNISLQQLGLRSILYGTTAEWNSQQDFISEEGVIYIYSDYQTTTVDGVKQTVPGIKIGDGKAYLIDIPFITQTIQQSLFQHITNSTIHTNSSEKNFWNQKITSFMDSKDSENLIFSNI